MRHLLTCIVLSLAVVSTVLAQLTQEPIRVWADGASYMYFQDRSKSYVEVYCAIQRKDIQFEERDGKYEGKVYLYLEVMDQSSRIVDSLGKWMPISLKFLEDAYKADVRVFEAIPCLLASGNYKMRLTAIDGVSKRNGIATFDLAVRDFSSDALSLSDIELAYDIIPMEPDTIVSALIKADRKVIPNPNRYVSNEDSLLYLYAELYNLVLRPGSSEEYELKMTLLDSYGYELREFPAQKVKKPGSTSVITEALSMAALPGGTYELQVHAEDLATGRKANSSKKFQLIYSFNQLTPTMTDPDSFTDEDAALMEQVIRYITTKEEKQAYSELNLEGKKKWLEAFWERNNAAPGSKINSFKNERFRRFIHANYNFSTTLMNRTDGWKSDRGRIYMTYGPPDQTDRSPAPMGQKPYERWFYDRLPGQSGGNFCLFVDETGYGDYRLVHSTLKGEISDPRWETLIEEWEK